MSILGLEPSKSEKIKEVSGKWAEIQLLPDLATGEVLNIGVCFKRNRAQEFLYKLAPNLGPLSCLFGNESTEQFKFLLEAANEHLTRYGDSEPFSPHVRIGRYRPASGLSEEEILDSQFERMVTIARSNHGQLQSQRTETEHVKNTATKGVQKRVKRALQKESSQLFERVWQDEPFTVLDKKKNISETLNFQIWDPNDSFDSPKSACIGSAWYTSEEHREFFLANSFRSISIAKNLEKSHNSKMMVFLLKPDSNSDFTKSVLSEIQRSVDKWAIPLKREHQVELHTEAEPERLTRAVLSFIS
jgi:hypothetical protein